MGGKKHLLLGLLIPASLLVGCGQTEHKKGDLLYNENFEVIRTLDETEKLYEVRDTKTGVHYMIDWYDDSFTPYYTKDGEIKQTEINEKYKDKE